METMNRFQAALPSQAAGRSAAASGPSALPAVSGRPAADRRTRQCGSPRVPRPGGPDGSTVCRRRPSSCPSWKKRMPGVRYVSSAAGRCISHGNAVCGPRLVVILQEAGAMALEIDAAAADGRARRGRRRCAGGRRGACRRCSRTPAVARTFPIPVTPRPRKTNSGRRSLVLGDRGRPEEIVHRDGAVAGARPVAQVCAIHVRQQQHRHVAANAVATVGDRLELVDHRPRQVRMR